MEPRPASLSNRTVGGVVETLIEAQGTDRFYGDADRDQIRSVDIVGGGRLPGPDTVDGGSHGDFCTYDTIDVVSSCFVPGEA